ncbi:MAG: MFS transporter [Propionibacteriaceae bacterium]
MTTEQSTYRAVLQIRNFRLLALGAATSEIGDWLYKVALLVYVYAATDSPAWVAAATVGRMIPYVFLAPLGGLLADRFERLRVMQISNLARLVVFGVLTVAVAREAAAPVVILLAMLGTAAGAAYRPASTALLPALVGESQLAPAMAFLSTQFSVALVVGPALGALILAIGPPALAFGVNAATFGISALFLHAITRPSAGIGTTVERPSSAFGMLIDGLRAVRDTPYVPVVTMISFLGSLCYGAKNVLILVYAEQQLGVGADGYGYLVAAAGAGGVLVGLLGARLVGRPRLAATIVLTSAVACFGLVGYALTSSMELALVVAVVIGASLVIADVVTSLAITRAAAGPVLGRIFGAIDGLSVSGTVLGALLAPVAIGAIGLQGALLLFGGVTTAATVAAYPRLRRLDRAAAQQVAVRTARLGYLSGLPIFAGAPAAALEQLAGEARELSVGPDVDVVVQGEGADAFYVVLAGQLSVSFVRESGEAPEFLRTLAAGDGFGEIGLLEGIPRTATVQTTSSCRLLRISGDTFSRVLRTHPRAYGSLRASAASRLSRTGG